MDILGLYQGSAYTLEFPVTVNGAPLSGADAVQFDMYLQGALVHSATLCNDVTLSAGVVTVSLPSDVTVNFSRGYKFELWFMPTASQEKHIATSGVIQFIKTTTRISVCQ